MKLKQLLHLSSLLNTVEFRRADGRFGEDEMTAGNLAKDAAKSVGGAAAAGAGAYGILRGHDSVMKRANADLWEGRENPLTAREAYNHQGKKVVAAAKSYANRVGDYANRVGQSASQVGDRFANLRKAKKGIGTSVIGAVKGAARAVGAQKFSTIEDRITALQAKRSELVKLG